MSFSLTTSTRAVSVLSAPTPPGIGPGRYETARATIALPRPSDSALGSSAFAAGTAGAGAGIPNTAGDVPGPGTHRPEVYGTFGARGLQCCAPRTTTLQILRKPLAKSREEVRERGTAPSIPMGTRSSFGYEEDEEGRLTRVRDPPKVIPSRRVGPGCYTPCTTMCSSSRAPRTFDFGRRSGRVHGQWSDGEGGAAAAGMTTPQAPGWHDGSSFNPLPSQQLPSSSFAPDPLLRRSASEAPPRMAAVRPTSRPRSGSRPASREAHTPDVASLRQGAVPSTTAPMHLAPERAHVMHNEMTLSSDVGGGAGAVHTNRHSRGRTRVRAVLVASTGVPGSRGEHSSAPAPHVRFHPTPPSQPLPRASHAAPSRAPPDRARRMIARAAPISRAASFSPHLARLAL